MVKTALESKTLLGEPWTWAAPKKFFRTQFDNWPFASTKGRFVFLTKVCALDKKDKDKKLQGKRVYIIPCLSRARELFEAAYGVPKAHWEVRDQKAADNEAAAGIGDCVRPGF